MDAEVITLYRSPICSVHNFLCRCQACTVSKNEYVEQFVIAYIRKGNFQFNAFKSELDAYHGLFLINKPGYEYKVRHEHDLPDECTIFSIPSDSLNSLRQRAGEFAWFFNNPDKQSILVRATPSTEYLHHSILRLLLTETYPRLLVETMITELLLQVLRCGESSSDVPFTTLKHKKYYMPVIENIKLYMNENFTEDISLPTLADIGNLSIFHFNRLFKKITSYTPYKYLLTVRLQSAQLQIRNTRSPVTDIAFSTGFKSLEHFSASYKNFFGISPSEDRFK
jgi:AraC family transcriptional regulator